MTNITSIAQRMRAAAEKAEAQLAELTAEPVYQFIDNRPDEDGYAQWADCNPDYYQTISEDERRTLYTAPPAPVDLAAVLDSFNSRGYEIDGNGITLGNLARAVEVVFSQLDEYAEMAATVDLAALVPDEKKKLSYDPSTDWGYQCIINAEVKGWNAAIAEMLRRIEKNNRV